MYFVLISAFVQPMKFIQMETHKPMQNLHINKQKDCMKSFWKNFQVDSIIKESFQKKFIQHIMIIKPAITTKFNENRVYISM